MLLFRQTALCYEPYIAQRARGDLPPVPVVVLIKLHLRIAARNKTGKRTDINASPSGRQCQHSRVCDDRVFGHNRIDGKECSVEIGRCGHHHGDPMKLRYGGHRPAIETSVTWTIHAFGDLALDELYDILALRQRVFIVEQRCPFLDADGLDPLALHISGRNSDGTLIAYLRIVPPGLRFALPSIGRVVTAPEVRKTGIGRALMLEGIHVASAAYPGTAVQLSAQQYLERFYSSFGFVPEGMPYEEDGIPHITMVLRPT